MRRRKRTSRDVSSASLTKLSWLASRPGSKGREALRVLQDALQEQYPTEFEKQRRRAKFLSRRKGRVYLVMFSPTMERAIHKYPHQREWYRRAGWPFSVIPASHVQRYRQTATIIYDTEYGFDHVWADTRQFIKEH